MPTAHKLCGLIHLSCRADQKSELVLAAVNKTVRNSNSYCCEVELYYISEKQLILQGVFT